MASPQTNVPTLGVLQTKLETATKTLKAANTAAQKANEAQQRAEADHNVAAKALAAGVAQIVASTKVA
jgi:hypothetical protein